MSGPLDALEWRPESRARQDAPQADTRPAPSTWDTIAAGFRTARADTAGYDEGAELNAYKPVLTALEEFGYSPTAFVNPARGTVSTGDVWRVVNELKRKGHFAELPATEAEFDKQWRQRNRDFIERNQDTAARGSGVAAFAGGMAGAMTDPVNIYTLPVGGAGSSVWRRILSEGAANMAVEAFQTPIINAQRQRQGRPGMTASEIAMGIGMAGAGAAAFRGGIELAPKIDAAGYRALAPLRERIGTDRVSDQQLARAFAESVPAHLRTPDEAAAVNVAMREFEIDEASPYQRTYAGIDANGARLAEAMEAIEAGRIAVERPRVPSATLTTPEPASRPSAAPARSGGKLHGGIVGFLRNSGLSDHLARGIAAGIEAESRSSHTIVNPTSGAFGIGQWLGPRKKELFRRYGKSPSMQQQLEFLVWELRGGDHGGKSVLGAGDEAEALRRYIVDFMRPAPGKETTGDLSRGMAALGRGAEDIPVDRAPGGETVAPEGDPVLDAALAAEAADVDARRAALDDEPLTPQAPQLRRDGFGSDSAWRIAQAESDAAFAGIDAADDLLYRLRQVVVDREGKRSLNRADELAAELGTTPAALREGLDRLAELGEITRRKDGRYGRLATGLGRADRSLVEWIADRGGIDDTGGDIAHMGGANWHRGAVGRGKLIRPPRDAGGMFGASDRENTAEALFEAAISDGYFPELAGRIDQAGDADIDAMKPDIAIFLAAIERELGGDPVRSVHYDRSEIRVQRGIRNARDRFQSDEHYELERDAYNATARRLFGRELDEDEFLEAWDMDAAPLPGRDFIDTDEWIAERLLAMTQRRLDEVLDEAWLEAEDDAYDVLAWEYANAARREGEAGRDRGEGSAAVGGDAGEGGTRGGARPRDAQTDELGALADRADEFGLRGDAAPDEAAARAFDDDAGDGARMAAESAWHDIRQMEGAMDDSIGPFGPVFEDVDPGDWQAVRARLNQAKLGEVRGALQHPELGAIDMPWGKEGTGRNDGFGLAKLERFHPEVVEDLPRLIAEMTVTERSGGYVQLESPDHRAAVRLDWDGRAKTWLLTAFRKEDRAPPATKVSRAAGESARDGHFPALEADPDVARALEDGNPDAETYDLDDGSGPRTAADIRADLDAQRSALEAMRSCLK